MKKEEYKNGYILDGFPRTLEQVEKFENGVDKVIYLRVSDKEALWRLSYRNGSNSEEREDETLAAIRRRIELFHKLTKPVLDHYKKRRILGGFDICKKRRKNILRRF